MLKPTESPGNGTSPWNFTLPKDAIVTDEYAPLLPEDERTAHLVHQRLIQEVDVKAVEKLGPDRSVEAVEMATRALLAEVAPALYGERKERVIRRIVDDAVGLGPLQPLVNDLSISEVMVNSPDEIYFERDGIIYLSALRFRDRDHVSLVIDRIIAPLGRRVDESSPFVDARLPIGSRVNIIIPPLVPRSPTITIRKFRPDKYDMEDLVAIGTITQAVADFLRASVQLRLNVVISGGTGTGKTTLLSALSAFIPERERIITIEDPIELKLHQRHVIACEARPPNIEGRNEVAQRDLLRNALRMRPDRIIVGEVRGAEAFDMLQAMNTGHEGSLTTVHSNSPRDALSRIENMMLMASVNLPLQAIRAQVASAINLVVQVERMRDGIRRVERIVELSGMEGQVITARDLFTFQYSGQGRDGILNGTFEPSGLRPDLASRATQYGLERTVLEAVGIAGD